MTLANTNQQEMDVSRPTKTSEPESGGVEEQNTETMPRPKYLRQALNQQAINDLKLLLGGKENKAELGIASAHASLLAQDASKEDKYSVRASKPKGILSPEDLGSSVRSARKMAGLSQADIAEKAHVGKRFMVDLERGKSTLEFGKVLQVLSILGLGVWIE
ncbi:MAG: helix-turn-helix transcriptional regulator [Beijerinckiaceae bacterium]